MKLLKNKKIFYALNRDFYYEEIYELVLGQLNDIFLSYTSPYPSFPSLHSKFNHFALSIKKNIKYICKMIYYNDILINGFVEGFF